MATDNYRAVLQPTVIEKKQKRFTTQFPEWQGVSLNELFFSGVIC